MENQVNGTCIKGLSFDFAAICIKWDIEKTELVIYLTFN